MDRTAFVIHDGGASLQRGAVGANYGLKDIIQAGTRVGVLQGLLDFEQQKSAEVSVKSGGSGGVQNASFETWDGSGGGGSGAGRSGGQFIPNSGAQSGSFRGGQGTLSAMAKEFYDFWSAKGYDHNAALSMVSQEQGESGFDINARGDHGGAHDAFQWHAERRAQILAGTGINVDTADHQHQLEAAYWESTKGSRAGLAKRMQGLSLRDAVALGVSGFEGSKNQRSNIAKRFGMARGWDGGGSFRGDVGALGESEGVPASRRQRGQAARHGQQPRRERARRPHNTLRVVRRLRQRCSQVNQY